MLDSNKKVGFRPLPESDRCNFSIAEKETPPED